MLLGWLVFPLVLGLLALGCGVALEYLSGRPLRGALLAPLGLAVLVVVAHQSTLFDGTAALALPGVLAGGAGGLVVVAHPATLSDATAELAVPAVLAVAAAGLVLASGRPRPAVDPWAAGCALAVFAAYAAPVLLSGEVGAAGYVKLDDTASWLAL